METQDVTERNTTADTFAEYDHVSFGGTREIRRAMAAARTVMGKSDGADRWSPSCRLVGHPGRHEVEVLATDGDRAMRMRVAAERSRDDEMFDEPLHGDAVRAMARTTTPVLTITATGDALVITERDGTERRFPNGIALHAASFARILDTTPSGAVAPDVTRTTALRALRAMPPQSEREKVCRMSISRHGLMGRVRLRHITCNLLYRMHLRLTPPYCQPVLPAESLCGSHGSLSRNYVRAISLSHPVR